MEFPVLQRFEIKRKIAHKACFTTYEAVDKVNGYTVHLKILDRDLNNDDTSVANFLSGARIIKRLNHPNICQVLDFGHDPKAGLYYIANEPNQLDSFNALILDEFSLSLEDLVEIMSVLGKTLRYAHLHGLVHGFLNPDSIYIKPDGSIKIDDLGFSWSVPLMLKKEDESAIKLAKYVAPEYFTQPAQTDGRSDIYSLGLILHQLLNGAHPITGNTIEAIRASHLQNDLPPLNVEAFGLPDEIENVVFKAAESDPESRFQNVKSYLQALENLRQHHLSGSESENVDSDVGFALTPDHAQKYFMSEADGGDKSAQKLKVDFSPPGLLNKKFAFTSAGAVFLVILILFVTNYIPLPFLNGGSTSNNGLQDYDPAMEPTLLGELENGAPDEDSDRTSSGARDEMAGQDDNDDLLAAVTTPDTLLTLPKPKIDERSRQSETEAASDAGPARAGSSPDTQSSLSKNLTDNKAAQAANTERPEKASKPEVAQKTEAKTPAPKPVQRTAVNVSVLSNNLPVEEANVFVNDQFVGKTRSGGVLSVPDLEVSKSYTLKVSKEGYNSSTRRVTVSANTPAVKLDIQSRNNQIGTVLIDAVPRADQVFIDGVLHKGATPLTVSLKHGTHKIRLVNAQLNASHEETIDLKIGQVLRVRHDFTQEQTGKVAVSLKNAAQFGFGYVYVDGKLWPKSHNTTPLEIELPVGSHTIEVRRDGFNSVPKDVIVQVENGETKYVSFTFMKSE